MIAHYSGAGNTFYLFDHRQGPPSQFEIPKICQTNNLDGCIFIEESQSADVQMRIFNADGSEAEMCGNGLRCLIHFLHELGINRSIYFIETVAGIQRGWLEKEGVSLALTPPHGLKLNVVENLHFLNTGVPHVVQFVDNLDAVPVEILGKQIRESSHFAPKGANVNFVTWDSLSSISIRTYERGVERETSACGTGAVASALITNKVYKAPSPIEVKVGSGEKLKISFSEDWSTVEMFGLVKQLARKKQKDIMAFHE